MSKTQRFRVSPDIAFEQEALDAYLNQNISNPHRLIRRSIDARGRNVVVDLEVELFDKDPGDLISYEIPQNNVSSKPEIIIVGAGPAGLFAALRCIELDLKPIIIERGKDVRSRRRDIAAINKDHVVDSDSNYCFGEGGAGTYSDGKLYTRSKKRGDFRRILEIFVAHGASEDILIDAHPHIGTNKLPGIIQNMRESILNCGGEVLFESRVTDFILESQKIIGVKLHDDRTIKGQSVILATGHSARDIFRLLKQKEIQIEQKPFALGVRVEHPQTLIDSIQYHTKDRGPYLPASSYSMVCQTYFDQIQRGAFSFCMCPGGFIVPSATEEGEVVVNGMSPSRRNSKFANSGIVIAVENDDLKDYQKFEELAAMEFQAAVERKACEIAGGTQTAPAQRLGDFVHDIQSSNLPECSYQPGLASTKMTEVLPNEIGQRLRKAFTIFGKKMKGYLTNDAIIVGVESRTSSPVRIPRDKESLEHPQIKGLFPCGEGAGYAGGIVSAAMDGEKIAQAVKNLSK